jgi:hypothetical protein
MLKIRKLREQAADYTLRADKIRNQMNSVWWDPVRELYHHYIRYDGTWMDDKQMMSFLLRWDVVPAERKIPVLNHILSGYEQTGAEMNTYYPLEFYRVERNDAAYSLLTRLMSPEFKRREYPEVSYAVLETIAMGMMGILPDAASRSVTTVSRLTAPTRWAELKDIPVFDGTITLKHDGITSSILTNNTKKNITWYARSGKGTTKTLIVYPGQTGSVLFAN